MNIGLKCFIIEGECLFPITATIFHYLPIIIPVLIFLTIECWRFYFMKELFIVRLWKKLFYIRCDNCRRWMKDYTTQVYTTKGDRFYCFKCSRFANKEKGE